MVDCGDGVGFDAEAAKLREKCYGEEVGDIREVVAFEFELCDGIG